jgi:hypothetical protein
MNLTFGSTKHLQIFVAGREVKEPLNWHLYAEATENFPSLVHLHVIESSCSVRVTEDIAINNRVNSSIYVVVVISARFLIQLKFFSSI